MHRALLLVAFLSDDSVAYSRHCSQNERFCFVVHEHGGRGSFFADGQLRSLVAADLGDIETVLVSDSGSYIVAWGRRSNRFFAEEDQIVAVYAGEGALLHTLTAGEVFTPNDRDSLNATYSPELTLRLHEGREILAIAVPSTLGVGQSEEIHIDLATGRRLGPKRDIHPVWQVEAGGELAPVAIERVMARYPVVARKARISGTVIIEVDVAESGEVTAARVIKPLPFGIDTAAVTAAKQWRFPPGPPLTGRIEFRFAPVTPGIRPPA